MLLGDACAATTPHRGMLIALFGLSAARVVALTLDDIELAVLIRRHLQDRANTPTAATLRCVFYPTPG